IFLGPQRDPYPYYAAAEFFVLPTRHDPCSLVVLEALAMGLPTISTAMNGACEIMTPSNNAERAQGIVLDDPEDIPALAAAMRRMLDHPTRHAMHEAALALRPQLSQERHMDRLIEIYEQCG